MMVRIAFHPCVHDGNAVHECRSGHLQDVRDDATMQEHRSIAAAGIDRPERIFSYRHPIGWNVGRGSYADTTPHPDSWRGRHVDVRDKHPEIDQGHPSTAHAHA